MAFNKDNVNQFSSKDISNLKELLKSQGVLEYDSEIIPKLLDVSYQLTYKLLKDCDKYIKYFDLPEVTVEIAELASNQLNENSLSQPISREKLLEIARKTNSEPLPSLSETSRNLMHFPPPSMCLFAPLDSYSLPTPSENHDQSYPSLGVIPSSIDPINPKSLYTIPASASYTQNSSYSGATNNYPMKRNFNY